MFYISYEMAAHRLTNLITRHFGIPVHFQRSDPEGVLWKAYENDGVLLPADVDGTIEGQRLCRWWSSRQAFESEDSYELHYQRTETRDRARSGASPTSTSIATAVTRSRSARSTRCRTGSAARTPAVGRVHLPGPELLPQPRSRSPDPLGRICLALGP